MRWRTCSSRARRAGGLATSPRTPRPPGVISTPERVTTIPATSLSCPHRVWTLLWTSNQTLCAIQSSIRASWAGGYRPRLRRWRIGHEDRRARLTRDDVLGYYRSRYVPERTIVAITGDIEVE